jgi:hypothetical protein
MENKVVSFRALKFEKMYATYFRNIENYNKALMMVGSAPKDIVKFKQVVNG